jgi:hypothetical protein
MVLRAHTNQYRHVTLIPLDTPLLESEVNNHVGNQYPALVGRNYERSGGSTIEVKGKKDK